MKIALNIFVIAGFQICLAGQLVAQDAIAEKLLEDQEESSEQSELYEILLNLRENPIDLNTATYEELEIIPGLSPALREAILQYRKKHSGFKNIEQLLAVPGVDSETYDHLRQLLTVEQTNARPGKAASFSVRSRVSDRIDRPVGFEDGSYLHSPQKIYHRLQYQIAGKIQGGLLIEKDSGERRWDDLRLFYLAIHPNPTVSLLMGNYQLEIGQGLVLWGPYGFSKSADAVFPIKKRGRAFRGYTSVDENAALFGGALQIRLGNFNALVFGSRAKLDANPVSENTVSGLVITGFHRNDNESSKKDVLRESVVGGAVRYTLPLHLTIGASGYHSTFSKTLDDPDIIRQRFDFRGKENAVAGFDWDWRIGNIDFFGEAAQSKNGGRALVTGALLDFRQILVALLFRDYAKDFQNLHGFGFADANGSSQNERGYYTGFNFRITQSTELSAYYDVFLHPWRTFFEPLPFEGSEFLGQLEQRFRNHINLTLRFRQSQTQQAETFKDEFSRDKQEFVEIMKRQWRLQLEYSLSPQLRLRNRFEFVTHDRHRFADAAGETAEDGFMMYQDIRFRPTNSLEVASRLTFFDTDSFNSGLFQYENDLPGTVTNRALFGEGSRWYVLIKYTYRLINLSVKYSETFRDDTETTGSGADLVAGRLDRRIGFQIDVRF